MNFTALPSIPDLINSEGTILSIVENISSPNQAEERIYIKGLCLNGEYAIYAKINEKTLEMFFQGRLTVKELFLLRKDEDFIIEKNGIQELVFCDEVFEKNVIDTIECGNNTYYSQPKDMTIANPFGDVLDIIKRDYMNGIVAISVDRVSGSDWINRNL